MMTESAFSIEELEQLYCLFKVKELQAARVRMKSAQSKADLSVTVWLVRESPRLEKDR